ncbi:MAG: DUF58 domain-containing protein [Planctomycetes bacterium]|nr:DUF58 domain-containing protein [Planctomycetota bacterium]
MGDEAELFDPQFLSRLRTLFFKLRKRRSLKKKGIQPTVSAGHTREFKDHRHYVPGDDFRQIDWRLFARHERMFIRIFEEIQEFHVHLLIDRSMSMAQPHSTKRLAALRLAIALAYLSLINQHRVSVLSMCEDTRREILPLKGQGHIHNLISHLASMKFAGVTDLENSFRQFRPGRDRRGIVFVISDLFGSSPALSESVIRESVSWPAETHVIHVLDPNEMQPDLEGEMELVDVETGEARRFWLTKREMHRYKIGFDSYVEDVERACMLRQVNYVKWSTGLPFEDLFLTLLSKGSALAGS